jgi:hypothetical protein
MSKEEIQLLNNLIDQTKLRERNKNKAWSLGDRAEALRISLEILRIQRKLTSRSPQPIP